MLRVLPFYGIRCDPKKVSFGQFMSPPYDVIPDRMAHRLRALRYNTIQIELPAGKTDAKYEKAAQTWRRWRRDGILTEDSAPSYYIVEQRFRLKGKILRRTGILAALG